MGQTREQRELQKKLRWPFGQSDDQLFELYVDGFIAEETGLTDAEWSIPLKRRLRHLPHNAKLRDALVSRLDRIPHEHTLKVLLRAADPISERDDPVLIGRPDSLLLGQLDLAEQAGLQIFYAGQRGESTCWLAVKPDRIKVFRHLSGESLEISEQEIQGEDVLYALIETAFSDSQRACLAQKAITDRVKGWFHELREEADRAFSNVPAVYLNTGAPIHVDWIVVFNDNGTRLRTYPASVFRDKKIRVDGLERQRTDHDKLIHSIGEAALIFPGLFIYHGGIWATTSPTLLQSASFRALIVHEYFCPRRLPKGGVSVTVRTLRS